MLGGKHQALVNIALTAAFQKLFYWSMFFYGCSKCSASCHPSQLFSALPCLASAFHARWACHIIKCCHPSFRLTQNSLQKQICLYSFPSHRIHRILSFSFCYLFLTPKIIFRLKPCPHRRCHCTVGLCLWLKGYVWVACRLRAKSIMLSEGHHLVPLPGNSKVEKSTERVVTAATQLGRGSLRLWKGILCH